MEEKKKTARGIIEGYQGPPVRIMEVCGTHTHEIFRLGIRKLLPPQVELISGPGCPVCVTPVGFIDEAVYGLCEINRDKVTKETRLVANPGCYTTCSILTAYPLVKEGLIDTDTLIVDAKSGTSGAGRGAKTPNLFCEVNESMKAYGVASHRHTPEIEEQLGYAAGKEILINFTPHLVPMNRGILATEYATLKKKPDGTLPTYYEIKAVYDKYYANEKFVRVLKKGVCPETKCESRK